MHGNHTFVKTGETQNHGKQGCIDDQGQQHKASSPQHHLSLDHLHLDADKCYVCRLDEELCLKFLFVEAWLIYGRERHAEKHR